MFPDRFLWDDGEAFNLVSYLCWVYMCKPDVLAVVLEREKENAEELLRNLVLLTTASGSEAMLEEIKFGGFTDFATHYYRGEDGILRASHLPSVKSLADDGKIRKHALESICNFYPFR